MSSRQRPQRALPTVGYWFKSPLFEIEPGEDEEVNPGRYGRQLAYWLKAQLERRGYTVADVFPEDWGWCVMCHFRPYMLWVGCGNMDDSDARPDSPPLKESVVWHCFPVAELPLLARLFKKIDTAPDLARLDSVLREILEGERGIALINASDLSGGHDSRT